MHRAGLSAESWSFVGVTMTWKKESDIVWCNFPLRQIGIGGGGGVGGVGTRMACMEMGGWEEMWGSAGLMSVHLDISALCFPGNRWKRCIKSPRGNPGHSGIAQAWPSSRGAGGHLFHGSNHSPSRHPCGEFFECASVGWNVSPRNMHGGKYRFLGFYCRNLKYSSNARVGWNPTPWYSAPIISLFFPSSSWQSDWSTTAGVRCEGLLQNRAQRWWMFLQKHLFAHFMIFLCLIKQISFFQWLESRDAAK